MMHYFTLRQKLIFRQLRDFGLPPVPGLLLLAIVFSALQWFLVYKTKLAPWIFQGLAFALCWQLNEEKKIDFLKLMYGHTKTNFIRIIENFCAILAFVVGFIIMEAYSHLALVMLVATLSVFIRQRPISGFVLPTPFGRRPYEFMIGFRKTSLLITALVMLMAIGMAVDNFNLSAVAFGAMVILPAFYFNEAEPVFYVWIYRETSLGFLKKKAWFAIVNLLIYALPAMILLMVVFQAQWWIPPLIFIGGMVFMLVMITAKYAAYPSEIGIAQAVLLYLSFQLPPLLLVVVPLFIKRSKRNLQSYLS